MSANTNFHLLPDPGGHGFKTYRVQIREVFFIIEMLDYFRDQSGVVPGFSISQVNKEVEVTLGVGVLVKMSWLKSSLLVGGDYKKNMLCFVFCNHN